VLTGPFRGTDALAAGLLTHNELYGPRFRRLFHGVFAPADLAVDLAVLGRAAYLLVGRRGGVLAGYSAALQLGADCAPVHAPAEVLVPTDARGQPGLVVRRGVVPASEVVVVAGLRVTSPARTAWDLARRLTVTEATVAVDALAHGGSFTPADLVIRRRTEPGARGCRQLADVVGMADPRAESPMESRLRLGLVLAGLPRPDVQYRVSDEHGFVLARVDLAYPHARLAIEYDGTVHLGRRRWALDRERDATLADEGWLTLRLGRDEVVDAMRQTAHRVNRLLTRRAPGHYGRVEIDTRPIDD
jgi:Protein of unknown function (DUF559)